MAVFFDHLPLENARALHPISLLLKRSPYGSVPSFELVISLLDSAQYSSTTQQTHRTDAQMAGYFSCALTGEFAL
jgi:hypothetical protein